MSTDNNKNLARKLKAILGPDVKGYSSLLMADDGIVFVGLIDTDMDRGIGHVRRIDYEKIATQNY